MLGFGSQDWDSNNGQEEKAKNWKEPTFVSVHQAFETFLLAASRKKRAGSLVNVSVSVHAIMLGIVSAIPDSTWFHRDGTSVLEIAVIRVQSVNVGSGILTIDRACRVKRLFHFVEFNILESCLVRRRAALWGVQFVHEGLGCLSLDMCGCRLCHFIQFDFLERWEGLRALRVLSLDVHKRCLGLEFDFIDWWLGLVWYGLSCYRRVGHCGQARWGCGVHFLGLGRTAW
jgi:hypothetical protein